MGVNLDGEKIAIVNRDQEKESDVTQHLLIAAEGATVITVARTQSDLEKQVKMIEDAGGNSNSHFSRRPYRRENRLPTWFKTVVDKYGRIVLFLGIQCRRISKRESDKKIFEHQAI